MLTFVLRFVVEGERFRSALNTQDTSRITSICLSKQISRISGMEIRCCTYDKDLIATDQATTGSAAGYFLLVLRV